MNDTFNCGDFDQEDSDIHNYLKLEVYNTSYPYPARFETESQFAGRMHKYYGGGSAQFKLAGELHRCFFRAHDELPQAQVPSVRVAPVMPDERSYVVFGKTQRLEVEVIEEWEDREAAKRKLERDKALAAASAQASLCGETM